MTIFPKQRLITSLALDIDIILKGASLASCRRTALFSSLDLPDRLHGLDPYLLRQRLEHLLFTLVSRCAAPARSSELPAKQSQLPGSSSCITAFKPAVWLTIGRRAPSCSRAGRPSLVFSSGCVCRLKRQQWPKQATPAMVKSSSIFKVRSP